MKERLYRGQYICMLVLFGLSGIFLPGIVKRSCGTAAYPAFLPALVLGVLLVGLNAAALRGGGSLAAIARKRLGNVWGSCVAAIYVLWFLWIAGELFCFYGLYISAGSAPLFSLIPIAVAIFFAAERGTTALGRTALIFAPLMLLFALVLGLSGFVKGDFDHFRAYSVLSWSELGALSLTLAVLGFGQSVAVMALAPAEYRKTSCLPMLLPNLSVVLIAATAVLLDGQTPLINRVAYFSASASGDFSELKIPAEFVLFFCTAFRLCICLRAAAVTTAELIPIKTTWLLAGYTVLITVLAVAIGGNIGTFAERLLRNTPLISVLPVCIIPILLLIFRKKG